MGRKIKPLAWCDGGITYKYEEVRCEEEILDKIGHAALHGDLFSLFLSQMLSSHCLRLFIQ